MVHCVYIPIPEEARVGDILKFNLNDGRRLRVKIPQHIGITKTELKITIPFDTGAPNSFKISFA